MKKIDENRLRQIVRETIAKHINEGCPVLSPDQYPGRNVLNEMARLNKRDGSNSPFPSDKFMVWVQGDNSPHKPPHLHISYPQEGWEIKIYIDTGQLWHVVTYGNRKRSDSFSDIIHLVREWFKMDTTMPGRIGSNQSAALNEWEACND